MIPSQRGNSSQKGLSSLSSITHLGRRKLESIPKSTEFEADILSISLYISGKLFS